MRKLVYGGVLALALIAVLGAQQLDGLFDTLEVDGDSRLDGRVTVNSTSATALDVAGGADFDGSIDVSSVDIESTAANALDIAGSLIVGSPILPQYLGTGTRTGVEYLRSDGVWAGVSPPTAVSTLSTNFLTTSTTLADTGLSVALTVQTATSDVLFTMRLNLRRGNTSCQITLHRGATEVFSFVPNGQGAPTLKPALVVPVLDTDPGAGTYTYSVRMASGTPGRACLLNPAGDQWLGSSLIGQVLR